MLMAQSPVTLSILAKTINLLQLQFSTIINSENADIS